MPKAKITNIFKKNPKWANKLWGAILATALFIGSYGHFTSNDIIQYIALGLGAIGTFGVNLFKKEGEEQ